MPAQQRIWFDDDHRIEERRKQSIEPDQNQSIDVAYSYSGVLAAQNDQLLPKHQNLRLSPRESNQPVAQNGNRSKYPSGLQLAQPFPLVTPDEVFGNHSIVARRRSRRKWCSAKHCAQA